MPLFKTRSSKIEPLIGMTDIGAMFEGTNNKPKMEHVFFNVASTDHTPQSNFRSKRAVRIQRMDDPEEICELSSIFYLTGTRSVDLTSSESPRAFYRRSMDFCVSDFPPPPSFLPSKKLNATEKPPEREQECEDEIVWKLQGHHTTTADKTRHKCSKWQLKDVDKTSQLRHNYHSVSPSVQNILVQRWTQSPDRFYNYVKTSRLVSKTASSVIIDERLKRCLFAQEAPHGVRFSPEILLFSCIQENNKDDLEFVLRHSNIDINICFNSRQLSPLHIASMHGYTDCVRVLLRYGSNVNCLDPSGHSPLHSALLHLHFQCAVLLIEAGADIHQFTSQKLQEFQKVKKIVKRYCNSDLED